MPFPSQLTLGWLTWTLPTLGVRTIVVVKKSKDGFFEPWGAVRTSLLEFTDFSRYLGLGRFTGKQQARLIVWAHPLRREVFSTVCFWVANQQKTNFARGE